MSTPIAAMDTVSRDSSPLSEVESSTSSPSPSTPVPPRSPSLDLSSSPRPPSADGPNNEEDDELEEDELMIPSGSGGATMKNETDRYGFNPATLPTAQCQWGDCDAEFYELEPFIEHLHNVHAFPPDAVVEAGKKAPTYTCDWVGCPWRGKNQTSKFALVGHLRSHTGEKPFHCPKAECDKSFTRTDALQKHMRIQHQDRIPTTRKPPTASTSNNSKKKKGARAGSIDSFDGGDDGGGGGGNDGASTVLGGEDDLDAQWADDELELFNRHPELGRGFVAYVLAKAKWSYLVGEHEGLLGELEAIGTREAELGAECEELLRRILRKELSVDEEDADNASKLESYLTDYSHKPLQYPMEWTELK